MGLPGTEFYLQHVFQVQEETLVRLGCVYLAPVVAEKKTFGILCIAPVLVHIRQVRCERDLIKRCNECCTEFVARGFYCPAVGLNCTGRVVKGY